MTAVALLLAVASCLLPGGRDPSQGAPSGFLKDYSLLKESKKVSQAYVLPGSDLRRYRSVRIPDFANYTGREIDPQALVLAAEAVTSELELLPPGRRPFQIIDRSPQTASAEWVDLLLEGAITAYEVRTDASGWTRLSEKVVVGIECRLVENKTGRVVALIRHRKKQTLSEVTYENPVREALGALGRDLAEFLSAPDVGSAAAGEPGREGDPNDPAKSRL
jgi:hypothetical protein